MEESHSDGVTMPGINQLIAADEIKQEPDVKEEPMETGDLVELPALIINQPHGNISRDGGADSVCLPLNTAKVEVKQECAQNIKEGESGKNRRAEGTSVNNRWDQHLLVHAAHNVKNSSNSNAHGNSSKPHQCGQCKYATKKKSDLIRHLRTHTGEKPFPCSHCPKKFTSKQTQNFHMKIHVEEFLFNCIVCLRGFDEENEKLEHEKECRIRRYECHLCKYSSGPMKMHLIRHIRIHTGTKPFQCEECSKPFARKDDLNRHMKTHLGPLSFYCSRCHLGFVHQDEMVAHEQKCSRRLYECYVCGKFIGLKKRDLVNHMRTHTGDKPFDAFCAQANLHDNQI